MHTPFYQLLSRDPPACVEPSDCSWIAPPSSGTRPMSTSPHSDLSGTGSAYFMAQVLHCSVLLPVITCYGAPLRSGFLDDVLLPTFCTQVNNTQKFHHYFIITHNQSGEWALEMSLTRPLFFLYFWEIRKLQGSTIALISAHTNIIHHLLYLATWNSAGH